MAKEYGSFICGCTVNTRVWLLTKNTGSQVLAHTDSGHYIIRHQHPNFRLIEGIIT